MLCFDLYMFAFHAKLNNSIEGNCQILLLQNAASNTHIVS